MGLGDDPLPGQRPDQSPPPGHKTLADSAMFDAMPSLRPTLVACAWSVAVTGCSVEPVSLDGKACPCEDGWTCEPTSNRCVAPGSVASGGAAGANTGGASGAATGGASGAATGGTSGAATGGTGGAPSGGSGGSSGGGTGGTAGVATGGAGGIPGQAGIFCPGGACDVKTQACCRNPAVSTFEGQCVAANGACSDVKMFCDDNADCGGAPNVCCAEIHPNGLLKGDVTCRTSCSSSGGASWEVLCYPGLPAACPSGMTCKVALKLKDYFSCQP